MQSSLYRNREGIDLLTGAPNERSLRIWMNHVVEPPIISKRPALDLGSNNAENSSLLLAPVDLTNNDDEWSRKAQSAISDSASAPLSLSSSSSLMGSTNGNRCVRVSHFDVREPDRAQTVVRGATRIRSLIAVEATGEIVALTEGGKVGLIDTVSTSATSSSSSSLFPAESARVERGGSSNRSSNRSSSDVQVLNNMRAVAQLEVSPLLEGRDRHWFFGIPRLFPRIVPVEKIVCGQGHVCLVTDAASGRRLYAWGANDHGQCGLGKEIPTVKTPTLVPGVYANVLEVGCGPDYTSCVASNDVVITLFSFGGGYSSAPFTNRLKGMLKRAVLDPVTNDSSSSLLSAPVDDSVMTVPHANAQEDVAFWLAAAVPLIRIHPGPCDDRSRPYNFWTKSLSNWVKQLDEEWSKQAVAPFTRLDVPQSEQTLEASIELENARDRLHRMRAALEFDVAQCTLRPLQELFEDPAPFEIRKVLSNVEFELATNESQLEMIANKRGFESDEKFLKSERRRILNSKIVYERLRDLWSSSSSIDPTAIAIKRISNEDDADDRRRRSNDRDVLYALLEDCRRSDISILARNSAGTVPTSAYGPHLGMTSTTTTGGGENASFLLQQGGVSLFTLLNRSDAILNQVREGLSFLDVSDHDQSLRELHLAVTRLYEKKKFGNDTLRARLTTVSRTLYDEVERVRDEVIDESGDALDLSHIGLKSVIG